MNLGPQNPSALSFVTTLEVLDALSVEGLQVFPLRGGIDRLPEYALLEELLDDGSAEVTEVDAFGQVPEVLVKNHALVDALILDGTELRGAKQNRMVNISIIVAAGSEAAIPVSCVEQGRWHHRSVRFASTKRTVGSRLRRVKAMMVAEGLRRSERPSTDQARVWRDVSEYLQAAKVESVTEALDDVFVRHEKRIDELCRDVPAPHTHGALVAFDGEFLGLDVFDTTATFSKAWPTLLRGYAMDLLLAKVPSSRTVSREDATRWIQDVATEATLNSHEVPGSGTYLALESVRFAGGIATRQGVPVHAALFAGPPSQPGGA